MNMKMKIFSKLLLLGCCLTVGMCADYQSHVGARQVAIQGQYDKTTGNATGGLNYRVEYR